MNLTEFPRRAVTDTSALPDLPRLFHRLNNQLGIILANSELLESRLTDEAQRARAAQVVSGTLEAIAVVHELRRLLSAVGDRPPGS